MAMKWGLMGWLLLSSLSMANSNFLDCYHSCFVMCVITPGVSFLDCPSRCLHSCMSPSTKNAKFHHQHQHQNQLFCNLGCATSSCTNFSTKDNPGLSNLHSLLLSLILFNNVMHYFIILVLFSLQLKLISTF